MPAMMTVAIATHTIQDIPSEKRLGSLSSFLQERDRGKVEVGAQMEIQCKTVTLECNQRLSTDQKYCNVGSQNIKPALTLNDSMTPGLTL